MTSLNLELVTKQEASEYSNTKPSAPLHLTSSHTITKFFLPATTISERGTSLQKEIPHGLRCHPNSLVSDRENKILAVFRGNLD